MRRIWNTPHAIPLLALFASLSLAGVAAAQTAVNSPFDDSVCMSPLDVTASLHDPNAIYAGAPKCEKVCKKALKDCKQYVKDAAACENAEINDDASYAKTECEVEHEHGTETKTCKTEVEHAHGAEPLGLARRPRYGARAVRLLGEHLQGDLLGSRSRRSPLGASAEAAPAPQSSPTTCGVRAAVVAAPFSRSRATGRRCT